MLTNDNKMAKVKDDKHGKVILLSLKAADVKKNMIKLKCVKKNICSMPDNYIFKNMQIYIFSINININRNVQALMKNAKCQKILI